MTIEEAKKARDALQEDLKEALLQFEKRTGFKIAEIEVCRQMMVGDSYGVLSHVRIVIEL